MLGNLGKYAKKWGLVRFLGEIIKEERRF